MVKTQRKLRFNLWNTSYYKVRWNIGAEKFDHYCLKTDNLRVITYQLSNYIKEFVRLKYCYEKS